MKRPQPVTCGICGALARRHLNLWQCIRWPRHIADLTRLVWFECGERGN
jgi:hypothetical protein